MTDIRTSNPTERRVADRLIRDGWEVMKRGWPDFLAYRDGEVRFVEVKPPRSRKRDWTDLSTTQLRMAEILHEVFGVEVEVLKE
jgi:hypothetical protein